MTRGTAAALAGLAIASLCAVACAPRSPSGAPRSDAPAVAGAYQDETRLDLSSSKIKYYAASERGTLEPDGGFVAATGAQGAAPGEAGAPAAPQGGVAPDAPFIIVDRGPLDALPAEVVRPSIYVVFSQPVVPVAALGKPANASPVMKIDPPLAGVFRWYGTRLLSFDASSDTLPQHEYRVTINRSTTSIGGEHLSGPASFSFHTDYLALEDFWLGDANRELGDVPIQDARRIALRFNYAVNLGVIRAYLGVAYGGSEARFEIGRPGSSDRRLTPEELARTVLLTLRDDPPLDTAVTVTVAKGARSEADFLGAPNAVTKEFHTLRPFAYVRSTASPRAFPGSARSSANPLFLEFNHPVDPASLPGNLRTDPPMTIGADNLATWRATVRVNDLPVRPESTYRLVIGAGVRDIYGNPLGSDRTVLVKVPPAVRYAYFPNTGTRMLEAAFAPAVVFEFQNVFDGLWRVGRIEDPYSSFPAASLRPFDASAIPRNVRHFEKVDLRPWLNDAGKGFVGFSWNFAEPNKQGDRPAWGKRDLRVEVTDLGVTVRYGANRVIALVSELETGRPVAGATVSLLRDHELLRSVQSDRNGLAELELAPGEYARSFGDPAHPWRDRLRVLVTKDDDRVEFEPNDSQDPYHFGIYNVVSPAIADEPRPVAMLFTDRGVYRPGESVSFRGIDRTLTQGRYGIYSGAYRVELRDTSDERKTIASLAGTTSDSGGLYGSFRLPDTLEPGSYVISYWRTRPGSVSSSAEEPGEPEAEAGLDVAEFRNVAFEVKLSKPDRSFVLGDTLRFSVHADYLSGGDLSGARLEYSWEKRPIAFGPAEWDGWAFGPGQGDSPTTLTTREGRLDAQGNAVVEQASTREGVVGQPYVYTVEARVQDPSRQLIAGRESATVFPADFMIGARLEKRGSGWSPFVAKGEEANARYALVAPDATEAKPPSAARGGAANAASDPIGAPGTLVAALYRVTWKLAQQGGAADRVLTRYERVEELEKEQRLPLGAPQGTVQVRPEHGGAYLLRLSTRDREGRATVTDLSFYATGSDVVRWNREDTDDIGLKADRPSYAAGDTAKLLVQSPLPEGNYLVTVERDRILDQYLMNLTGSAQVIGIPIKASYVPIVYVSVSAYSKRTGPPSDSHFKPDLGKPRGYYGVTALAVDPADKRIDLSIVASLGAYRPGSEAEVTITATRGGAPIAGSEISFLAVDRGVLDLVDYHIPNPLEFFYNADHFPLGVHGSDSRSLLLDPVTYEVKDLFGGGGGGGKAGEALRINFVPTAVFEPFLLTDRNGQVVVRFKLPDTLTTYRLTAVAIDRDRFGYAEGSLVAQNPINVRTALPRQLRTRDTAVAGVVVTNLERSVQQVSIAVESDLLTIDGAAEKRVSVAAGATVEVPFRLLATKEGDAHLTFAISSEPLTERLEAVLSVRSPGVSEAFTTSGEVSGAGAEEAIVLPRSVPADAGSLDLTLSGSRLAGLVGAVSYVAHYPFGCFEQRASALMPLIVFGDRPDLLKLAGVTDVEGSVKRELAEWAKHQLDDGGFPFWSDETRPSYYVTARVAQVLAVARDHGYALPAGINLGRLLAYLRTPDRESRASDYLASYALYVRSLFGEPVAAEARRLLSSDARHGIAAYALLGLALANAGATDEARGALDAIKRFTRPSTRTIDLAEPRAPESDLYGSHVEELALFSLLAQRLPGNDELTTRIANTLIERQRNGVWRTTSETNWALVAFSALAREERAAQPITARARIGDSKLLDASLGGPASAPVEARFAFAAEPLSSLARGTRYPLAFEKEGSAPLYYDATLRYAIPAESAAARDEGLGVYRTVTDLAGNEVDAESLALGATYRMNIYLTTPRHRSFVAIRVPVPSGADILDTSLSTTARYAEAASREASGDDAAAGALEPPSAATPRTVIHDDEVQYFYDQLPAGRQVLSFLFRTTSAGIYPTPPATAECMYEPEVFGRSDGELVVIPRM